MIIESGYRRQRLNCLQTFKRHALTHFTHSHTYAGSCQALYTHISMSAYKASESRHRLHLHKHKNYTSIDPKTVKTISVQKSTFTHESDLESTRIYIQSRKIYFRSTKVYVRRTKVYFRSTKVYFLSAQLYFQRTKGYFRSKCKNIL